MQQPPSQDPINPSNQSWPPPPPPPMSSSPNYNPLPPAPGDPTGQSWQSSPYPQSGQPSGPSSQPLSPSQANYPGEEQFYNQTPRPGGPNTQQFGSGSSGRIQPPPKSNIWKIATVVLLVLVLIFAGTAVLAVIHANSANSSGTASTAGQPTTAPGTTPGTTQPPATPAPNATPTQPSSNVTPTALAADGTTTENKVLTCGGCNDPIRFTINTVTIQNGSGRMLWAITLNNITGTDYNVSDNGNGITLQELPTGTIKPVTATGFNDQNGVVLVRAGDQVTRQLIFAFVPYHGVQYELSVEIFTTNGIDMKFDPVDFTF